MVAAGNDIPNSRTMRYPKVHPLDIFVTICDNIRNLPHASQNTLFIIEAHSSVFELELEWMGLG